MLGGGAMGAFTDVVRENSKIGMRGGGGGSVKAYDLALAPCCQRRLPGATIQDPVVLLTVYL